jgi:hypothetical protein
MNLTGDEFYDDDDRFRAGNFGKQNAGAINQHFWYVSRATWFGNRNVQTLDLVSTDADSRFVLDRIVIEADKRLTGVECVLSLPQLHVKLGLGNWPVFPGIPMEAGQRLPVVWARDLAPWWKFWLWFAKLQATAIFQGRKLYSHSPATPAQGEATERP